MKGVRWRKMATMDTATAMMNVAISPTTKLTRCSFMSSLNRLLLKKETWFRHFHFSPRFQLERNKRFGLIWSMDETRYVKRP